MSVTCVPLSGLDSTSKLARGGEEFASAGFTVASDRPRLLSRGDRRNDLVYCVLAATASIIALTAFI